MLKTAAVTVAGLFAIGVMLAGTLDLYFGSSKIRPLFGMSPDALHPQRARATDGGATDSGR